MNIERQSEFSLVEIAKALAVEKDLDKLLTLITHSATGLLGADRSSLYLYDRARNCIVTRVIQASEIKEVCLPLGQGIAGTVASTQRLINIPDVYADERFDRSWDAKTGYRTRNILCAPMLNHEGDLTGVLQVLNKHEGLFDARDEDHVLALGSLAAIAIDNSRLVDHYIEKKKMEQALEIARSIQMSLLPGRLPEVAGVDLAAWCQPCDRTGGDYYDVMKLEDGRLVLAVGDVTGHGIGPAILMSEARALIRAGFCQSLDLAAAMTLANRLLEEDMIEGRFVTLFFGVVDPIERTLSFSNAGHCAPMVYRPREDAFEEPESTGPPLGIVPGLDYDTGPTVRLQPGDRILLMTDGIPETMDPDRNEFGLERIREVMRRPEAASPKALIELLKTRLETFRQSAPLRDDVTMVALTLTDRLGEAGP